jgi:hypothetical protein
MTRTLRRKGRGDDNWKSPIFGRAKEEYLFAGMWEKATQSMT